MTIDELIEMLNGLRKAADSKAQTAKSQQDFIRYGIDTGIVMGLQQALFYIEMYKVTSDLEQKIKEGSDD